jgi:hypothetical protein
MKVSIRLEVVTIFFKIRKELGKSIMNGLDFIQQPIYSMSDLFLALDDLSQRVVNEVMYVHSRLHISSLRT